MPFACRRVLPTSVNIRPVDEDSVDDDPEEDAAPAPAPAPVAPAPPPEAGAGPSSSPAQDSGGEDEGSIDLFGEKEEQINDHFVARFAWLRTERSSHASPSYADTEARREAMQERVRRECVEELQRDVLSMDTPRARDMGEAARSELQRVIAISYIVTTRFVHIFSVVQDLRARRKVDSSDDLPFSAANLIALINADHFDTSKYNEQDMLMIDRLRNDPGPNNVRIDRHPFLYKQVMRADGRTGVPVPVLDEDGEEMYEDVSFKIGLSQQFINDMAMYTYLGVMLDLCEIYNSYMLQLARELAGEYPDRPFENTQLEIDKFAFRTFTYMEGADADNVDWQPTAQARSNFDRAYLPRSSLGRSNRYWQMSDDVEEYVVALKDLWDNSGTLYRHLLWRNLGKYGLVETELRQTELRVRVKRRFDTALAVQRAKSIFILRFLEYMDAVGLVADEVKASGVLDSIDAIGSGLEIEWDAYETNHLWTIDAILQIMVGPEPNETLESGQALNEETAKNNRPDIVGLRTQVKNKLAKVLGEDEPYDADRLEQLREQDQAAKKVYADYMKALSGSTEDGDDMDMMDYDMRDDRADLLLDQYWDMTPWMDDDRTKDVQDREKRRERRERIAAATKLKLVREGIYFDIKKQKYLDVKTGDVIGDKDSADVENEIERRRAGIPKSFWDDGIRTMRPGDKRRLGTGGKLLERPTNPGREQDEWDATKELQDKNEERLRLQKEREAREAELDKKMKYPVYIYDKRRGYRKATTQREVNIINADIERAIREEMERVAAEYRERRRQYELDNRERLEKERDDMAREAYEYHRRLEKHYEQMEDDAEAARMHGPPNSFGQTFYTLPPPQPERARKPKRGRGKAMLAG